MVRPGDSLSLMSGGVGGLGGVVGSHEMNVFAPNQPREKWIKKRTSVKIR